MRKDLDHPAPISLEDREFVTSMLRRHPVEVSELTFTNLFVWRAARPVRLARSEDALTFLVEPRGILGPPLGEGHPLEVARALAGGVDGFTRISKRTADALQEKGLSVMPDRDNADYVYRVADLAQLAGRKYAKKRNLVRQCLDSHRCEYEPITPGRIAECVDLQHRWCRARDCGKDPGLCGENLAILEAFAHYETLRLLGGAVRVDGRIEAFALGEELSPGTAVCHFEKAMTDFRGLGQLINQWFALHALGGFEFVNREQDLGLPGLRQAKESYHPHHLVEKYSTTPAVVSDPRECDRRSPAA